MVLTTRQKYDIIVILSMVMFGGIFFALSASSFDKLQPGCSTKVRSSLTAILTFSAILITVAASYGICQIKSGKCYLEGKDVKGEIYFGFGVIATLGMIVSCAIILSEMSKNEDICGGDSVKRNISAILGINAFMFIVLVAGWLYSAKSIKEDVGSESNPIIL